MHRTAVAYSGMTGNAASAGNAFESQLWNWFDHLTEIVALALIEGRVADFAIVSASGSLIVLGLAGGPTTIILAALASSVLMAGDLAARLNKWKAADTEEARLAAATALVEVVATLGSQWLESLHCRP